MIGDTADAHPAGAVRTTPLLPPRGRKAPVADTAAQFIRCNLMSSVVHGNVTASGGLYYRLEDGNVFRLPAKEARVIERLGYTPRFNQPKVR